MNLREPKKKCPFKVKEQLPFPIALSNKSEWTPYTAYLTPIGSCIINPDEIVALHTMGSFGKGSLSRGFPSFGLARYGAPPIIRNRQWIRRQEWLEQFDKLSTDATKKDKHCDEKICSNLQTQILDEEDMECLSNSKTNVLEIDGDFISLNEKCENNHQTYKEVKEQHANFDSVVENDMTIIVDKHNLQCNGAEEEFQNCEQDPYCSKDTNFKKKNVYLSNSNENVENKLLVLPDSDSETETYLKEIKPKIEYGSFPNQETLHLTFEETFFLLYGLGCLNLINFDGNLLNIDNAWYHFCKSDVNFIPKYVVYHYFRAKGWIVKPGLKYGGDFLLYKRGPGFYHASYIVIIDILDGVSLLRDANKCMHKLNWNNLFGLERLSEAAAKEVLFAQVLWPASALHTSNLLSVDILPEFTVRELLWRRWNPKHNKDAEEDDDDSY